MLGPTFCRTLAGVIAAVPVRLPCVVAFDPAGQAKNSMAIIHASPSWPGFGEVAGRSELPNAGKELHPFGWNACPGALCHHGTTAITAPAGAPLPDRPGIRSSRTYGLDTKPGPRTP